MEIRKNYPIESTVSHANQQNSRFFRRAVK